MAIPTRYRGSLETHCDGQLIVTIDTEVTCLLLYTLPEWETIEAKIQALPSFNPRARRIQRLLIGHATELELDGNSRILLPPLLREYAGLEKHVVLVGQGKKLEIWDEDQWRQGRDQWLAQDAGEIGELPEELKTISL